ncbi:microfibril-associated glycoprotein 4-like [Clytia hemisphaerica]|uniref:microfibril-associated glycoprotein 4-like n=1 Tax=Clytia hemisphaerica TaxID=252671 RepID=UPI0034D4CD8F
MLILLLNSFILFSKYSLGMDPNLPFLPFKHLHTNTAIDGPRPWFDGEVFSKDHCFHKCIKNFTDCEYVQYKELTVSTWICKLYGVISDLSNYLVSSEEEMLAQAVHENIDCEDWMARGYTQSGVYWIYFNRYKFKVFCNMVPKWGTAYAYIQRRLDGSVDFNRNWEDYKNGFGNIDGEHWLGLENIHKLTHGRPMEIRLTATAFEGSTEWVSFQNFSIENEANYYRLNAGSAGNGEYHDDWLYMDGMEFSTPDVDRDIRVPGNCAVVYQSGWWYGYCFKMNFNGVYRSTSTPPDIAQGIVWRSWKTLHELLKKASMMVRRHR